MADRELDVLLWGATGFTGGLVAEYLVKRHPTTRFAIGGRNAAKLDDVKRALAAYGDVSKLPVVVADPASKDAMTAVARRARVVASTAGPFNAYGRELLGACAREGTHYCDLTGEPTFVRWAIDHYHDVAVASGARIVPCCGFDSIPSDLGVLVAHEALAARGSGLRSAELCVASMSGAVSGGTAASMLLLMEEASRDPETRRLIEDPHALDPPGSPRGPDVRDVYDARFDESIGKWTAPFIMRAINGRIVRRSNAILGHPYGQDFRYDERVAVGRGFTGRVRASAMAFGMQVGTPLLLRPGIRNLVAKRVPKPGTGPSREKRERGKFVIVVHGVGKGSDRVTVTIRGEQDPGYGETAKMIAEAALALAGDPAKLPPRTGVLTPASGIGDVLVERLRAQKMSFDVS